MSSFEFQYLQPPLLVMSSELSPMPEKKSAIDPFSQMAANYISFVIIKIALTNLVFQLIIQKNFYSQTSSLRLI